jgi:hypothetical protein
MRTFMGFIVGVILGILLLYVSRGSFLTLLNSQFLQTIAILFGAYLIYAALKKQPEQINISAFADQRSNTIKLLSTSNKAVYITGYSVFGNKNMFNKPRLIPNAHHDEAHYSLPALVFKDTKIGETFPLTLFIEDEYGRNWISDHEILLEKHPFQDGAFVMKAWSHKIRKAE